MIIKFIVTVTVTLCCLLGNFAAIASTPMDTLIVAHKIDEMITLDPAAMFEFAALEYASNTYERLLNYNTEDPSKLYGVIAKSWQVSADGTKYTFKLEPGRKFASGNLITADDVVFSLQRVIALDKSPASILTQFGLTKGNIEQSIQATAPDTVVITLGKSYAPGLFLHCLTTPVASIVDQKLVLQHVTDDDLGSRWLSTNHAGSGPYQLQQWRANELLALTANPYYPTQPAMAKIVTRHVSEASIQTLLLKKGDIDIARNYLGDLDSQLTAKFYKLSAPKNWLVYMALNQQHPQLQLPQVRQAIKYLIDYQAIESTIYKNQAKVHQSFIPEGVFAVNNDNPYSFNLEKARSLLQEVGLEKGFKVTMDAKNMQLGQAIQSSLARANINVEILSGDSKQILTKFRARKYDMLLATWDCDYSDPHANASTFVMNTNNADDTEHKTLAWRSSWSIPELSKQASLAAEMQDPKERFALYQKLQQKFLAESPLVVLLQQQEVALLSNNINGFQLGSSASTTEYKNVTKVF